MKTTKRIIGARLIFVCEEYIDYFEQTKHGDIRRYAQIDPKDFPVEGLGEQAIDRFKQATTMLVNAIVSDGRVDLLVETREVLMEHANPKDKSPKKTQLIDYLLKVEYP